MGLIGAVLGLGGIRAGGRDPLDDRFWSGASGFAAASGIYVTPENALRVGAVFQATRLIAETFGSVPLLMFERLASGGKDRAPKHPLAPILRSAPNDWQTAQEWIETTTGHVVLRGNAFSKIVSGPRGFVEQLIPLHPDRVTIERIPGTYRLRYRVRDLDAGADEILPQERVFHLRGLGSDGFSGLSPVSLARDSFGLALAYERHGAKFFSQAARPAGALSFPGKLNPEAKAELKKEWSEAFSGDNAHKTAVLEYGLKWQELGMAAKDAQYLEGRNFQIEDVARWFNIPAHMLMVSRQPTYASIEQFAIEFVVYTLRPWAVRWEQAIGRDLIADDTDRFFAEFLLEALLRGSTLDRYNAYKIAAGGRAWMSPNEIRERENLNPGDASLDQVQEVPQGAPLPAGDQQQPGPARPAPATPADQQPNDGPPRRKGAGLVNVRRARLITTEAAERVVRKEVLALTQKAKTVAKDQWPASVAEFYGEHASFVAETLQLEPRVARGYAERQCLEVIEHGLAALERRERTAVDHLVELAMEA